MKTYSNRTDRKPALSRHLLAALTLSPVLCSSASAITLTGDTADRFITGTAAGNGTSGTGAAVGVVNSTTGFLGRNTSTTISVLVYVFKLPTLAAGQSIANASFTITNTAIGGLGDFLTGVDLYGLGYRSTSTVVNGDYFVGTLDTTDATLVQDNFISPGPRPSATAVLSTDTGGGIALTAYLNAQYNAGAVGGDYVFLRFNNDAFDLNARIQPALADNTNTTLLPVLTYDVAAVPEPSTSALLAGGMMLALAVLNRRPRARRS